MSGKYQMYFLHSAWRLKSWLKNLKSKTKSSMRLDAENARLSLPQVLVILEGIK